MRYYACVTRSLTRTEQALLDYLRQRAGSVVSPDALLRDVWGYDPGMHTRTVQVTVQRLRSKIEVDPRLPRRLVTVRGEGYRYVAQDSDEGAPPGRADLIDEIGRLETPLITLLGPVGVGKSEVLRYLAGRAALPVLDGATLEALPDGACFIDGMEGALPRLRTLLEEHQGPVVTASRVRLGLVRETIVPVRSLQGTEQALAYRALRARLAPTVAERRDLDATGGFPFLIRLALELPPDASADALLTMETPLGARDLPAAHRSVSAAVQALVDTSQALGELLRWWATMPTQPPAGLLSPADCAVLADHGLPMDGDLPRFVRGRLSVDGPAPEAIARLVQWAAARWQDDDLPALAAQWANLESAARSAEDSETRQALALYGAHAAANQRPVEAMALVEATRTPFNLDLEVLYGMLLLIVGRLDEGLAHAQRLQSSLDPGSRAPVRLLQLGMAAYSFAGRYLDAVDFMECHRVEEGGWKRSAAMGMVWKHYAMALLRLKRADEAKAALIMGRLRSSGRGRLACTYNLAACELLLGRLDDAERLFDELDDPETPELLRCGQRIERAMLAAIRGLDDEAVAHAEGAVSMAAAASWGGEAEISLARVYAAAGRVEEALGILDGLMSQPTRASLQHSVHLWRAVCWRRFALPDRAEAELATVPTSVVALYRAWQGGDSPMDCLGANTRIDYGLDAQLLARLRAA